MEKIDSPTPASPTRYPWRRIADEGGWFRLHKGTDYTATDASVCNAAYSWGTRHGLKAHVRHPAPGTIEVCIGRKDDHD